jgi:hypothetical protein
MPVLAAMKRISEERLDAAICREEEEEEERLMDAAIRREEEEMKEEHISEEGWMQRYTERRRR